MSVRDDMKHCEVSQAMRSPLTCFRLPVLQPEGHLLLVDDPDERVPVPSYVQ